MGLKARLHRLWYVWSWRARYWWFDTQSGEYSRWALVFFALFIGLAELSRVYVKATLPHPAGEPQRAIYWWIVQLIIVAIAAAASYAMRPRPKEPTAQKGEAPTVEDGLMVIHHFGECWIENEFILAWKIMGTEAIKSSGGK